MINLDYLYNPDAAKNILNKNYFVDKKLGFKIIEKGTILPHRNQEGWTEEVTAPEQAGITGKSKSIYGIKIRLDEAGTKESNILYRVHKFDGEWTPWAKNGETSLFLRRQTQRDSNKIGN